MSMEVITAAHFAKAKDLQQAGVKGMKWGFRKQSDGTVKKTGRTKGSADHQKKVALKKKKLSEMSNDEIKDLTRRLELERKYRDLNPGIIRKGQTIISQVSGVANSIQQADRVITSTPQGRAVRDQALQQITRALQQAAKK